MPVTISSKTNEKTFTDKEIINIGSNPNCDFVLNVGYEFLITVQYNIAENKCVVINSFNNPNILFKGESMDDKIAVSKACKLMFANSDEALSIKILAATPVQPKTVSQIAKEGFTEEDFKGLYGKDSNATTKIKIEKQKTDIEAERVAVIKQVQATINDMKKKLSANTKTNILLHIALYIAAFICSFAVANYLTGLSITEAKNYLHMPTNIKILFGYSIVVYGLCLLLKQGVYLYFQNKIVKNNQQTSLIGEKFMITTSTIFMVAIYAINLIYFMQVNPFFAVLISLFFVCSMATLAIGCGYFKGSSFELTMNLNKYEYREDFEKIIKNYQLWIERHINNLSNTKINNIKEKLFNLQLKSTGEILLGIFTAPFLAYGVSNTLAMCFPEAAGWIRISGLRFSPVFLVLATFLIVFAFFAFVNGFLNVRKIQASNVIKQDGFSNYLQHGVEIYGLEGIRKLTSDVKRSFLIGICIIGIEFTMNVSFFAGEIGGDLQGLFLSLVAALVPTALLIAETYMLSQTKFDIQASEDLIAKIDKD